MCYIAPSSRSFENTLDNFWVNLLLKFDIILATGKLNSYNKYYIILCLLGLHVLDYHEWLAFLGLECLELRQLKADLSMTY